jgi:hypothetical protein
MPEYHDEECRLPRFREFEHLGGTFRAVKYFTTMEEAHEYMEKILGLFDKVECHKFSGEKIWAVLVMPPDRYPKDLPPA